MWNLPYNGLWLTSLCSCFPWIRLNFVLTFKKAKSCLLLYTWKTDPFLITLGVRIWTAVRLELLSVKRHGMCISGDTGAVLVRGLITASAQWVALSFCVFPLETRLSESPLIQTNCYTCRKHSTGIFRTRSVLMIAHVGDLIWRWCAEVLFKEDLLS